MKEIKKAVDTVMDVLDKTSGSTKRSGHFVERVDLLLRADVDPQRIADHVNNRIKGANVNAQDISSFGKVVGLCRSTQPLSRDTTSTLCAERMEEAAIDPDRTALNRIREAFEGLVGTPAPQKS